MKNLSLLFTIGFSIFIFSCNSEKKHYNDIYEKMAGNYEIAEIKYFSSTGADSSIYDVGTMYFSPCEFNRSSSLSYCDGTILLQNPEVNGIFTFKVQQQDVLKLNIRIEENDFYRNLHKTLSVHDSDFYFDGNQLIIIIEKNPTGGSLRPYELVLSKY